MIRMQALRNCTPSVILPQAEEGHPIEPVCIPNAITSQGRVNLHVHSSLHMDMTIQAATGDVAAAAGCMKVLAFMQSSLMSSDICA